LTAEHVLEVVRREQARRRHPPVRAARAPSSSPARLGEERGQDPRDHPRRHRLGRGPLAIRGAC
jgi:hypothetical protein